MPTFKFCANVNEASERKMSNYLEIDSKILEKNLLLKSYVQNDSSSADNLENFLLPENYVKENVNWILVTPTTGFCLKTTDSMNRKVFINICKTEHIPEPKDITEDKILELWASNDVPNFKIPLSIQYPHDEFDNSGKPAVVYDVAINTTFYNKIQTSILIRSFIIEVVMQGLQNKYNIQLKSGEYVVLKNRKSLGELKPHRIRKAQTPGNPSMPLIEELDPTSTSSGSEDDAKTSGKSLEFRIFENTKTNLVIGEFYLPHLVTHKDLTLHLNDSRVILEHKRCSYFDFFIPTKVNEAETKASFDITTKILTVKMPKIISATV